MTDRTLGRTDLLRLESSQQPEQLKVRNRVFTLSLAALVGMATGTNAQTVDEIVQRVVDARGGEETQRELRTITALGYQLSPADPDNKRTFELFMAIPNRIRVNVDLDGNEVVYACDGEICWMVNPEFDITEPVVLPPDAAIELQASMDILGPFLDWEERVLAVEFAGMASEADEELYVERFVHNERFYVDYYINASTYSIHKYAFPHLAAGEDVIQSFTCRDYGEVSGIMLPHYMESSYSPMAFQIVEYRTNDREPDDSLFSLPRR